MRSENAPTQYSLAGAVPGQALSASTEGVLDFRTPPGANVTLNLIR